MTVVVTAPRSGQVLRRTRQPASQGLSPRVGPVDGLAAAEVLELIPALPQWARVEQRKRGPQLRAAAVILDWLQQHPGDGWQARWLAAGADNDTAWLNDIVAADPRTPETKRGAMTQGLSMLLLCRVVLPEYTFFSQ